MARLILDTGVVIAGVRGHLDVAALADTDDVAIPAIAVAEYLAGAPLRSFSLGIVLLALVATRAGSRIPSESRTRTCGHWTPSI